MIEIKKLKGVTLIELVLTIAIISILINLLIIKSSTFDYKKEKAELKLIITSIKNTKNAAISSRTRQSIEFDFVDSTFVSTMENKQVLLKFLKIKSSHPKTNTNKFIFTENGAPGMNINGTNSSGTIIFEGKKNLYRISVEPVTGKVNMEIMNE